MIAGIMIREESSNVTLPCCPKKGINEGMKKGISIRMPKEPPGVRDRYPPQNKIPSLHETMEVKPYSYAKRRQFL